MDWLSTIISDDDRLRDFWRFYAFAQIVTNLRLVGQTYRL